MKYFPRVGMVSFALISVARADLPPPPAREQGGAWVSEHAALIAVTAVAAAVVVTGVLWAFRGRGDE